jgi:surface antigen
MPFCNARAVVLALVLASGLPFALGGCSLTMHLASLQDDPESTASITRPVSPLDPSLDEEDWRRAQAALSLAVDPQGSGQPVNWDNPASKRKGTFAASGNLVLVDNTICRPFTATIQQAGLNAREIRHQGQACRIGPGEWALRQVQPAMAETTASSRPGAPAAAAAAAAERNQPFPAPSTSMLDESGSTVRRP